MSNEFPNEADDQMSAKKSSQQRLLLLLLLLVGLFAYLYFFTGLIRPRQDQPAPQPAPEAMVRKPLPPRPASVTAPSGEPASGTAPAGEPGAATAPAGKPGATAQAPTAPPAPAKPAQPAAATAPAGKPAATTKAAPAAKPGAEKSAKATAPEAKPAKPAAPAAKAKTEKPTAPATTAPSQAKAAKPAAPAGQAKRASAIGKKTAAKPAAEANGAKKSTAAAKSAESEKAKLAAKGVAPAYALEINDDLLESEVRSVTAKLNKAGIGQVMKTKSQKGESMHRLYLADFADRNEAVEQLERLKLSAPDAFMLRENGRYTVYAGSYLREGKAAVEQDRLYDKGVKLLLKSATAPVAVVKLRAGSFATQVSAEQAAKSLKQAGLSAKVVKVAK